MNNRILLSFVALISFVSLKSSLSAQDIGLQVENGMRVLFGADTIGAGDKLMFFPDLHAFRVGTIESGAASTYWDRENIGLYSFASGFNNRAEGLASTAMGKDCQASDTLTFAAGFYADAKAVYSVAIGNNVRAESYSSTAIGRYNIGGGNADMWVANDPIFEIGIGSSSADANALTVLKNGNVGIGVANPASPLHVAGLLRLGGGEYFTDGGSFQIEAQGDIRPSTNNLYDLGAPDWRWDDVYATNGTINTSDRRDKENITPINYGLNEILELRPVSFTWKHNPAQGVKLGLIAQELNQVISEVVKTHDLVQTEEGSEATELIEMERMGVYYSDLIPVLVKAIQEQQVGIAEKKERIEKLEADVAELKDLTKSLIAKNNTLYASLPGDLRFEED